jgi:hypothetical protein
MSILFFALLMAGDVASSSTATTANPAPVASEEPKEEKKICKRQADTTSRMGSKRICLTAAEWKERQYQTVDGLGFVTK